MPQNIAGIDVHKKLLVVIIADPAKPDVVLQSRRFGTGSAELQHLSAWLCQYGVEKAIPEPEQRAWRMVTRGRLQLIRERVQLQNQIESLLEEGRVKLSSVITDLLGASGGGSCVPWRKGKPVRRRWRRWATKA